MRIDSIRIAWFRGAADVVELDAGGKSMMVYGQNGTGKSSFVDAIEYVIENGRIGHLASEHSGRRQEKAVPNTHTPEGRTSELWIKFAGGGELHVRIAPNGVAETTRSGPIDPTAWEYRRTVLRQDEVSDFIRATKGEKYSALLPLLGLHELEVAAENLRQLAKAVEAQGQLAQKQWATDQTAAKRMQAFGADTDDAIEAKIEGLHTTYCPASHVIDALERCKELDTALTRRIEEFSAEDRGYLALRALAGTDIAGAVKAVRDASEKLAGSVEPLISEKLEVLQSADTFAAKLEDHGEVVCPACGRAIPAAQFKAHVKAEQERMKEVIAAFKERQAAVGALVDVLKAVKATLGKDEIRSWRDALKEGALKADVEWIEQCASDTLRQSLSEDSLMAVEDNCLPVVDAADKGSQSAPPEIKDLSRDKILVEAAVSVFDARKTAEEIAAIEGLVAFLNTVENRIRSQIRDRSVAVIKEISGDISRMWEVLHPGEPIEDVRLYLPENDKAIDIALKFHGKEQDSPRLTLSEGYRNSLGLCIFLAMAKREADHDRPLFLDDVVVSFDRDHRGMIVQLLNDFFADRQVIVFTHDRDWYAELRVQLDEKKYIFRTLLPYETPEVGIRWSHKTTTFDDARALLKERPDSAGNDARKIMDVELSLIAEKLRLRLPYLRGDRNDKRTWFDFLERLIADGKKSFQNKVGTDFVCNSAALEELDKARRLLASWGNKSSHSVDVVPSEAGKLIDACETAREAFICNSCGKPVWFSDAAGVEFVQCQCGNLRWRYGKG